MNTFMKSVRDLRKGSVMFMAAAGAVFMIGLIALVTDVGWMYFQNARIQTAVNAGWKAGFDHLTLIAGDPSNPTTAEQNAVNNMVIAVMNLNMSSHKQIPAGTQVVTAWDPFTVRGSSTEGLFFARVFNVDGHFNFNEFSVAAQRQSGDRFSNMSVIPLTIPHGVVKDLTRKTFSYDSFESLGQDGFIASQEYILKLGEGNAGVHVDDTKRLLVPMGAGDQGPANNNDAVSSGNQTNKGYLRAYGVAYWCLKNGYKPVEWLIGYDGGSFFLPYDSAVITQLETMGVNYTEVIGIDNVNAILAQCQVIELNNYPVVGVYSSQAAADAVEVVLQQAQIPYTKMYDGEIIDGALGAVNWVHMHHEDFTGWTGGCQRLAETCYSRRTTQYSGTNTLEGTTKDNTQLCTYCRNFFYGWDPAHAAWTTLTAKNWGTVSGSNRTRVIEFATNPKSVTLTWVPTSCVNYAVRCAERATWSGTRYWDFAKANNFLCENSAERPMCQSAKEARTLALAKGFADDAGYVLNRKWLGTSGSVVVSNGGNPLPLNTDFIKKPHAVQKMKFEVVNKLHEHVAAGGYMYSQCFAPETLDMALYQRRVFLDQPANPALAKYYDDCFAFTGFTYKGFIAYVPYDMYYSSINEQSYGAFKTDFPNDPRCQNHTGADPNFSNGHCDSFPESILKNKVTVLGDLNSESTTAVYIKGEVGAGEFCFAGGHFHNNIQSQRLVANNILLGALSTKVITGGEDTEVTGRSKNNWGVVDPDNEVSGGAGGEGGARTRFMYGFNEPLTIGDRLIGESGNMATIEVQGVPYRTEFAVTATNTRRFVIVPIHDIPPEVGVNNTKNATATTIYDLQGQDPHADGRYLPDSQPGGFAFSSAIRIIGFAKFEVIPQDEFERAGGTVTSGDTGDLGYFQAGQIRGRFVEYVIKPGEVSIPY